MKAKAEAKVMMEVAFVIAGLEDLMIFILEKGITTWVNLIVILNIIN